MISLRSRDNYASITDYGHFPDNTLLMKLSIGKENEIVWKYENDGELFAVYCIARHIKQRGYRVGLVMKYIPNARQDRVKEPRDVFTLKYFSELINSCGFDYVEVLDPHSPVSEALINNIRVDNGAEYIENVLKKLGDETVIYYPDNGAHKKYSSFISIPACYGVKKRDWDSGKILGLDISLNGLDIKGKTILMVDDIIAYGGSMYYGAKELKALGCGDIYIYATHIENSILEGELIKSGLFKKIYTTDSLFNKSHNLIEVLREED